MEENHGGSLYSGCEVGGRMLGEQAQTQTKVEVVCKLIIVKSGEEFSFCSL